MHSEIGRVPKILIGHDALAELPAMLEKLDSQSVLIVADAVVSSTGYSAKLAALFAGVTVLEQVVAAGEPTVSSVNAIAVAARTLTQPLIVAVGGGSALDTAKQVAAIISGSHGIEHYLLCSNPFPVRRPIVAIPTTAGTGAEVTRTCIVSDAGGRKMWTWGDEMLPDAVILDPSVTLTIPATVTAATGLDAFVHALEASTGRRQNMISNGVALQAMRLVRDHLETAVEHPTNLEARQGMQEAALLAGMAIDNCGTGIAHCIGHALGTLYHIPHGIAVTVALEATLGWNVCGAQDSYVDAANIFGVDVAEFADVFDDLLERSQFTKAVRALKHTTLRAEKIAEIMNATENQPMLKNNAREVTDADRLELAQRTVAIWNAHE
jgi:alcohol dehydrogenase